MVRVRGVTCQLRPPTPSQRRVSCAAQVRLGSLSLEGDAALELAARGPCLAGRGRLNDCGTKTHQRPASLLRFAPVL